MIGRNSFVFLTCCVCLVGCGGTVLLERTAVPAGPAVKADMRPALLEGDCDIAVGDHFVRTALRATFRSDTTSVACVDELGVVLTMATVTPQEVRVGRWFPPLNGRHATLIAVSTAATGVALGLRGGTEGTYRAALGDAWLADIVVRADGPDSLVIASGKRARFRGAVTDSTLVVTDLGGEMLLAFRRAPQ